MTRQALAVLAVLMEDQAEQQRPQRVTLLYTFGREDDAVTQKEM